MIFLILVPKERHFIPFHGGGVLPESRAQDRADRCPRLLAFCVVKSHLSLHRAIECQLLPKFVQPQKRSVQGWLYLISNPMRMFIGVYFQVTSWLFEIISFLNVLFFCSWLLVSTPAPQRNCVRLRAGATHSYFTAGNKGNQPAFTLSHRAF